MTLDLLVGEKKIIKVKSKTVEMQEANGRKASLLATFARNLKGKLCS